MGIVLWLFLSFHTGTRWAQAGVLEQSREDGDLDMRRMDLDDGMVEERFLVSALLLVRSELGFD